jgi:hypothetical protein
VSASETCSTCGQEVRWGWRDGHDGQGVRQGYWHRELVDHMPKFGKVGYDKAEVERQRHLPRVRTVTRKIDGELVEVEETYTTAELELKAMNKAARDRAADAALDEDEEAEPENPLEPVEVRSFDMPLKGDFEAPRVDGGVQRSTVPGGCRTLLNLAEKLGWEVVRLTYARGPYLGSKGGSLGVSDSVRLILRGPVVDGDPVYAVASWRDAKSQWAWKIVNRTIDSVGARALAAWMKEVPRGTDPPA